MTHFCCVCVMKEKLVMLAHPTCTHLENIQGLHTGRADGSVDIRKMVEAIPGRCPNALLVKKKMFKSWFSKQ